MGMFDYVKDVPFECPNCGYEDEAYTWQTKHLERLMGTYEEGHIMPEGLDKLEVHSLCPRCNAFVQGYARIDENNMLTSDVEIDEEESHIVKSTKRIPISST